MEGQGGGEAQVVADTPPPLKKAAPEKNNTAEKLVE
jgi:hypothetical protein